MSLISNTYFGITSEVLKTKNFNISLTNHSPNSEIRALLNRLWNKNEQKM